MAVGEAPYLGMYAMIAMWMTICWNLSGGHFNPCITVAMLINSKKLKDNMVPALLMIVGQLVGAMLGLFFAWNVLTSKKYLEGLYPTTDIEHNVPNAWVAILAPVSASYGGG